MAGRVSYIHRCNTTAQDRYAQLNRLRVHLLPRFEWYATATQLWRLLIALDKLLNLIGTDA